YTCLRKFVVPLSRKSMSLPGVAMHISMPLSRSCACGPFGAPPKIHEFLTAADSPKQLATS
ncbi:hypothetical protein X777_00621, partial [Ooceraea biroi]